MFELHLLNSEIGSNKSRPSYWHFNFFKYEYTNAIFILKCTEVINRNTITQLRIYSVKFFTNLMISIMKGH